MIISRSIHVAADGMISFFLMANIPLYIIILLLLLNLATLVWEAASTGSCPLASHCVWSVGGTGGRKGAGRGGGGGIILLRLTADWLCPCRQPLWGWVAAPFPYSYLFIYLWLHWVFVAARGLSLVNGKRRLLFIAVSRLLIAVASLVVEHTGSRRVGFRVVVHGLCSFSMWAQ